MKLYLLQERNPQVVEQFIGHVNFGPLIFLQPSRPLVSIIQNAGFADTEGEDRPRKRVDHSRLTGGKFNKQGNLHTRLVLSSHKTSRSPHLPAPTVEVYTEAFTRFSHTCHPDDLNNRLFSKAVFGYRVQLLVQGRPKKAYSKDQNENLLIAWVQLPGQSEITS